MLHTLPPYTSGIPSPDTFTFPFCYEPHPLCIAAAQDITPLCRTLLKDEPGGKMFGVLVVQSGDQRYYLAAFSGQLCGTSTIAGFVPPVYNLLSTGYFAHENKKITDISRRIDAGEDTEELRTERRQRSHELQEWLFRQFNFLNAHGETHNLTELFRNQAPILSPEDYFNGKRKKKPVDDIRVPSGAGECCAPKLLQYAYLHRLTPLCMAEFWLEPHEDTRAKGEEMRIDGNYYPACQSKCKPILTHMLQGLNVEPSPLTDRNRRMASKVQWIYEDSDVAVLFKPSGLLSAPGKDDVPSLLEIVRERYPEAMFAHRLDMDTSGLIVFGLNAEAYKHLQSQFITHKVKKQYMARLHGKVSPDIPTTGEIRLPLLPNPLDRPRQMVNFQYGKTAVTQYEILPHDHEDQYTLVRFTPHTGRTHQLRIHSAHPQGLGTPIEGDNLYGTPSTRLYLCSSVLGFTNPTTGIWHEYTLCDL